MASVGPRLPPSLAVKRKREEESGVVDGRSDTSTPSEDRALTPDTSAKRPRTIGPTLPPASLDERPAHGPEGDSDTSSSDDDFGPSLPGAGESAARSAERAVPASSKTEAQMSSKSQRDEWMIVPPSNSDWSARMDPTKLKARKFNTGKGANAASQSAATGGDNKWTETPAEKMARLEREMMGITDPAAAKQKAPAQSRVKTVAASQRLREHSVSKVRTPLTTITDVMTGTNSGPITIQ